MHVLRFVAKAAHWEASGLSPWEAQQPSMAAISAAHGPAFFSFLGLTLSFCKFNLGALDTPDICTVSKGCGAKCLTLRLNLQN